MADSWFTLSREDQAEALEVAAAQTGRPAHLLEKDIWVVWTLSAIYESALAEKLTFKGGTSLSKVYKIIDRFSEDIDLTYDIFRHQWSTTDGRVIPVPGDLGLGNVARSFDSATVLYADLDSSTTLVDSYIWQFSAEVYKAYTPNTIPSVRTEILPP